MDHCDGELPEDSGIGICRYDPSLIDFDCADCWRDKEPEVIEEGAYLPRLG